MYQKKAFLISLSLFCLAVLIVLAMIYTVPSAVAQDADLQVMNDRVGYAATGYITMLRIHDVGSGYGPPQDFLDTEVVIALDSDENLRFGFQLRDDEQEVARKAMLDILRDAFNHDWLVTVNYWTYPGKQNGEIFRVWITKPPIVSIEE